jgi:hypothetical protein
VGPPAERTDMSSSVDAILSIRLDYAVMAQGPVTASEAERLLRRAARRITKGWTVKEVPGKGGRRRGKGSHNMVGLYDQDGAILAWTTIPQHPGDLSPRVSREIEAAFEPHLGKGWMGR